MRDSKNSHFSGGIPHENPNSHKIMAALTHEGIKIPEGWKPEIARRLAMRWATIDPALIPCDVLDRAEILFKTINGRFEEGIRP